MDVEDRSLECTRDIEKFVGGCKNIERDFYSNDFLNNDLVSKFWKKFWAELDKMWENQM